MPRTPRIIGDDLHYHVILRCNNREHLLYEQQDFEQLLHLLDDTKKQFRFRLYNYDLLHTHIHLMLSTHKGNFIDQIMHDFCLKFAKDYNKKHKRIGHFWAHRYRSRIIFDDHYGLACLRYQHRNTLSAGIVTKPEDWQWSGYTYYAFGTPNHLLEPHPSYLGLSDDPFCRQLFYRRLVNTPIPSDKSPHIIERGNGQYTQRLAKWVKQVNRLKESIKATLPDHMVPGTW